MIKPDVKGIVRLKFHVKTHFVVYSIGYQHYTLIFSFESDDLTQSRFETSALDMKGKMHIFFQHFKI